MTTPARPCLQRKPKKFQLQKPPPPFGQFCPQRFPYHTMATVLPPKSKRQKLADSKRTQEQQKIQLVPETVPNVVVHLRASDTGDQLGGELHIPGNSTAQQLNLLVNSLLRTVTTPIPVYMLSLTAQCSGRRPSSVHLCTSHR